VFQESQSENINVFVFASELTFREDEEAFSAVSLEEVLSRLQNEDLARHLDADWFKD